MLFRDLESEGDAITERWDNDGEGKGVGGRGGGDLWTVDHTVAEVKRAAARPVDGETLANKVLSTRLDSTPRRRRHSMPPVT